LLHDQRGYNSRGDARTRFGRAGSLALAATLASLLLPGTVHAQYLDPGAGSIIVQALVAAVVGVAAVLKFYGRRIAGIFSRRNGRNDRS
jgi:hypothetical protein